MPAGFEVDPDRLDAMADRFRHVSHDLNDLRSLTSSAAAVDLEKTWAGPSAGRFFAEAWEQFANAYKGLTNAAEAIGSKLNQNAAAYREIESRTGRPMELQPNPHQRQS